MKTTLFYTLLALGLAACGSDSEPAVAGWSGPTGEAGATGQTGAPGNDGGTSHAVAKPGISGISPASMFIGARATLLVSGNATNWTGQEDVVFEGESGLVIDDKQLASPNAMILEVHAEPTAVAGKRSLRVGTDVFVGFDLRAELQLQTLDGVPTELVEGTLGYYKLVNLNPNNPFVNATDLALYRSGVRVERDQHVFLSTSQLGFQNVEGQLGAGYVFTALADVGSAEVYDAHVVGEASSPILPPEFHNGSRALEIRAGAAEDIGANHRWDVSFAAADRLRSKLVHFTPAAAGHVYCAGAPQLNVGAIGLGPSGRGTDRAEYAKAGEPMFWTLFATHTGEGPFDASLPFECAFEPAVVTDESEPNDVTGNAVASTKQAIRGAVAGTDKDIFTFTAVAANYGFYVNPRSHDTRLTVMLKNHAGVTVASNSVSPLVGSFVGGSLPAGAASIEIYADQDSVPAQAGGDYELVFNPPSR